MTREFCDRCDREIPREAPRCSVRIMSSDENIADAIVDAICEDCARGLTAWMRLPMSTNAARQEPASV